MANAANVESEEIKAEDDVIFFEELDIQSGIDACSLSLIRRVPTKQPVNKGVLKEVMELVWR